MCVASGSYNLGLGDGSGHIEITWTFQINARLNTPNVSGECLVVSIENLEVVSNKTLALSDQIDIKTVAQIQKDKPGIAISEML